MRLLYKPFRVSRETGLNNRYLLLNDFLLHGSMVLICSMQTPLLETGMPCFQVKATCYARDLLFPFNQQAEQHKVA